MSSISLTDFQIQNTLLTTPTHSVYVAVLSGIAGSEVTVRLTVFSPEVSQDTWFRRAFKTDRGFLETLRHKSLARFLGSGESDGRLFFWTEICRGLPVSQFLEDHQNLSIEDLVEIGWQACSALQQAHNLGFTHGGISPETICVTDDLAVSLVDFGVARWLRASADSADQNRPAPAQAATSDWRRDVESDLRGLAQTIMMMLPESADEISMARTLRRLLERVQLPVADTTMLSARDLQGRLGELLIADGDAIEMVDRREHPVRSRWSIVDDLFPTASEREQSANPEIRHDSPEHRQILLIVVIGVVLAVLLTAAVLIR